MSHLGVSPDDYAWLQSMVLVRPSLYIAFEGGEGAGKSTQAKILAERLDAVLTKEPGGTPIGARLRELLLDPETVLDSRAEALLMSADRAQHRAEVLVPAREAGRHIVSDRSLYSFLAYQGGGRGLDQLRLMGLTAYALYGEDLLSLDALNLYPDVVIYLDPPSFDVEARLAGQSKDRFEREADGFSRGCTSPRPAPSRRSRRRCWPGSGGGCRSIRERGPAVTYCPVGA